MKTRSGFVSNSSSSSFIVKRMTETWGTKPVKALTKDVEKDLKKQGFVLDVCFYPDQVDYVNQGKKVPKDMLKLANWVRAVACNQEDEIEFLLASRISFSADIHYEHRSMQYDGKTDVLLIAQNYGKQMQMSGTEKMNFAANPKQAAVERTTGKQYLKTHKV